MDRNHKNIATYYTNFSIVYVITEVRKGKFSIKESIYWFLASLIMLILAIFPTLLDNLAAFLGIGYSPSLLFTICIIFLLFINFRSSRKIAEQEGIAEDGYRLIMNTNRHGGQEVYHIHMHLLGGRPLGPMLAHKGL